MIQKKENYAQFIDLEKMYDNKIPYHRIINPSDDNSRRFENTRNTEDMYLQNKSANQRLVGPPNPKTLEKPVIVPRSHDLQHWKTNNLVVPSFINKSSNYDNYRSGYSIQLPYSSNGEIQENYKSSTVKEEQFEYPKNVIGGRGFNDNEIKNIYTQTLQPGIYSTTDKNNPISSNIGISYQPQFQNTVKYSNGESIIYSESNKNFGELINSDFNQDPQTPTIYNTFDPRFNGYGSDNRSYIDKTTGQQRFYYDDVNSVKMPNYICRSNIDFINNADTYGPIKDGYQHGNPNTENIREIAERNYLNSTLQFRSDLQESLMRKRNSEMSQLRIAPLNRNQQRATGGMGRF
jgi:hypothetical protein